MSRFKNFSRNLLTGYLQLGATAAYSFVSIPVILFWLPKPQFGLWVLLLQLISFVALIDLGMNSAIARLLVDHKDKKQTGTYGSLLKSAFILSITQAFLILAIVFAGASAFATLLNIPSELRADFTLLLQMQGAITAFSYVFRPLSIILYAHQRVDLQAYNEIFSLLASLGFLVFFLYLGCGIFSFIVCNIIIAVTSPLYLFWNCIRLNFIPRKKEWGKISSGSFKEMFHFGFQLFLFNFGCMLQSASQTIVISRALGLEAAATWAVGTKVFNLFFPVMTKPYGSALPGFYEMVARGEIDQLKARFRTIVQLTASLGVFLGGSYILCNSIFVGVWTSGRIIWPTLNDCLLGLWLFLLALQTTHCTFVSVTKRFGALSYVFLLEGFTYICLALFVGKLGGIPGIIACSVVCTFIFSYLYGIRRSCEYFQTTFRTIAFDWVRSSLFMAIMYSLAILLTWWLTLNFTPVWRLATHLLVVCTVGGALLVFCGLPREIQLEIRSRYFARFKLVCKPARCDNV